MSTSLPSIQTFISIFGWMMLCCIAPREIMRRSASHHYREWIMGRAYWGRQYDKWIVGNRVFYTDEFWGDIFVSILLGFGAHFGYLFALTKISDIRVDLPIFLATSVSMTIILFALRLYDRCAFADEEIARRQSVESGFSGAAEMERILSGDQKHIRRVLGRSKKKS